MRDLLPYRGLSREVEAALTALQGAKFDERAYRTLIEERNRRIPGFLAIVLPVWALGFVLVLAAQTIRWLPADAPWAYAFLPLLFVAFALAPLRPNAARDEKRLGAALTKWAAEAKRGGFK